MGDKSGENSIKWDEDSSLTYEDFETRICGETSGNVAVSYVGFYFNAMQPNYYTGDVILEATFSRSESWMCSDHTTEALLKHEQGHFDITELLKRECLDSLSKLTLEEEEFINTVDPVFQYYSDKLWIVQSEYDSETDHHRNQEIQKMWNDKIILGLTQSVYRRKVSIPLD
jgi:hypothetical protein